jgi:hypothetical protein
MYYYHFISRISFLKSYIAEDAATYWLTKELEGKTHWLNPQVTKQSIVSSSVAKAMFSREV